MRKKILGFICAVFMVLPCLFMFTACGKKDHKAQTNWYKNETHHWHACKDEGCEEKFDEEEHTYEDGDVLLAATEYEAGLIERVCSVCGYTEESVLPLTQEIMFKGFNKSLMKSINNTSSKSTIASRQQIISDYLRFGPHGTGDLIDETDYYIYKDDGTQTKSGSYVYATKDKNGERMKEVVIRDTNSKFYHYNLTSDGSAIQDSITEDGNRSAYNKYVAALSGEFEDFMDISNVEEAKENIFNALKDNTIELGITFEKVNYEIEPNITKNESNGEFALKTKAVVNEFTDSQTAFGVECKALSFECDVVYNAEGILSYHIKILVDIDDQVPVKDIVIEQNYLFNQNDAFPTKQEGWMNTALELTEDYIEAQEPGWVAQKEQVLYRIHFGEYVIHVASCSYDQKNKSWMDSMKDVLGNKEDLIYSIYPTQDMVAGEEINENDNVDHGLTKDYYLKVTPVENKKAVLTIYVEVEGGVEDKWNAVIKTNTYASDISSHTIDKMCLEQEYNVSISVNGAEAVTTIPESIELDDRAVTIVVLCGNKTT